MKEGVTALDRPEQGVFHRVRVVAVRQGDRAIIGVGNIGGAPARPLVRGDEQAVLAAREESNAAALAAELGPLASAATVPDNGNRSRQESRQLQASKRTG